MSPVLTSGMNSIDCLLQRNNFTPDNDPENRQFFFLDHEELADAMGVTSVDLPVIVDALGTLASAFSWALA
jgi:cytochrome oxidase assembly protein ShyY1